MQAKGGVGPDANELMDLIDEGLGLARSMENEKAIGFFSDVKRKLGSIGD